MKYWVSHLPLEVWMDVFRYPWISRRELGQIVDRFGNHNFAEYLQFYLHDWAKRTLDDLHFDKHGLYKYVYYEPYSLDLPQTIMPANIKSFGNISIKYFDSQTIAFLQQIGPILSDVQFRLGGGHSPKEMDNLRTILDNLVPLLAGIHSLRCAANGLPMVEQCFGQQKLATLKEIIIFEQKTSKAAVQATVNFLLNWLTLPDQDDRIGPRFYESDLSKACYNKISLAIREQFFAAQTPCTFALNLHRSLSLRRFAGFHLKNSIGEELHGVKKHGFIQITRHRVNCDTELQEWVEVNTRRNHRQIRIFSPTIGLINGMDAPDAADEDLQPSTSKKARIS